MLAHIADGCQHYTKPCHKQLLFMRLAEPPADVSPQSLPSHVSILTALLQLPAQRVVKGIGATVSLLQAASRALHDATLDRRQLSHAAVWHAVHMLSGLMAAIAPPQQLRTCMPDYTLPLGPPVHGAKYLIALNLHSSAVVAPQLLSQVLRLVLLMPAPDVFVSMYASGSNDATPDYLEAVADALDALGVHHTVLAGGPRVKPPAGSRPGYGRIEFLAAVRNVALRPLRGGVQRPQLDKDPDLDGDTPRIVRDTWTNRTLESWPADYVVFINDVCLSGNTCCINNGKSFQHQHSPAVCTRCTFVLKMLFASCSIKQI